MKAAILPDRGVVKVAGDEARTFLNGLLTADIADVSAERARYAALLTPQGKIIADCIVTERDGALLLDCPRELSAPLAQRLTFYKLRAKITIEDVSNDLAVIALWNGANGKAPDGAVEDPRLPALGWRIVVPAQTASRFATDHGLEAADATGYHAHRIALGVPHGGADFAYSDAFPHEADMDQLNGVDFDKGCYVGQEVVSRMEHRGTARNRVVPIAMEGTLPEAGTPVMAGGRQIGTAGSSAAGRGLAMLRLDRVAEAQAAGHALSAGDTRVTLRKPDWARFAFPDDKAAE